MTAEIALFIYAVLVTIWLIVALGGNNDLAAENRRLRNIELEADRISRGLIDAHTEVAYLRAVLAEERAGVVLPFRERDGFSDSDGAA